MFSDPWGSGSQLADSDPAEGTIIPFGAYRQAATSRQASIEVTVSSQPTSDESREQDIEQQLDELLSQLMAQEPDVVVAADEAASEADEAQTQGYGKSARLPESAVDDAAGQYAAAPVTPQPGDQAEASMSSDDELASQIQAMLDDARVAEASSDSTTPMAAAPALAANEADDADADVPIQAIDEMLAEAADDAVAGEFETVDEVLATQTAQAEASSIKVKLPNASAIHAAAQMPPAGEVEPADDHDLVEGSFETPEQLLKAGRDAAATVTDAETAAVTQVLVGSAAAVSAELKADKTRTAPHTKKPAPAPQRRPLIVTCDHNLRRILGLLNRPLDTVSPPLRNAIGVVGLLTLFNGGAMLLYSMLYAWS
jgi:hypothetical protein